MVGSRGKRKRTMLLQLTSLLFGTNAVHALTRRHLFYAILLLCLCAASTAWQTCDKNMELETPRLLFWIDQFAVWSVATMTMYYAAHVRAEYRLLLIVLSVCLLGLGIFVSVRWWNKHESPECHSAIHILSALSVHCVLLGLS